MTARRFSATIAVALACVLFGLAGVLWQDGYRLYIIHTGSMEPTLMPGDLVVSKPVAKGSLKVGEIITFRHSTLTTDVVTHRFIGYTDTGLINTKGDANASDDPWQIRPDQVRGAEAVAVPKLGYLMVFLKQPAGIGSVILALLALLFLWQLFFPATAERIVKRSPAHRRSRRQPASFPAPTVAPADISMQDTMIFRVRELNDLLDHNRVGRGEDADSGFAILVP